MGDKYLDLNKMQCRDCGKIIDITYMIPLRCPKCKSPNLAIGVPKIISYELKEEDDVLNGKGL